MNKTVFFAVTITLCFIISVLGFCVYQQYLDLETLVFNYEVLQANYSTLQQDHTALESEHRSLESEYIYLFSEYDSLIFEFNALVTEHNALVTDYNSLQTKYGQLQTDYYNLKTQCATLDLDYETLFSDYQLLRDLFDRPLTYAQVPSVEALQRWLWYEDQTETMKYDEPDFVCGDFAVMLAIHAKVKHWDMGVIGIWGYDRDTHEEYAHAFNAITTSEGLVYVEPQNDEAWWYGDHEEISIGITYEMGEDQWIYVEDVRIILQY